ncbi:hypothetical protein B0T21DRAFT_409773 [Apiosordaria backusii]|uniref:Secreted protein n=1 Tax=Apiosordaria backusii TaxID=314023 RepID=A0AA40BSD3_9PEZI|nr:hypothetical protein B0T21DRAFT_409773 [Apiosordaria backusii]
MKLVLSITSLSTLALATPVSLSTRTDRFEDPFGNLMTILGFYQNEQCGNTAPYWYLTTRLGTFEALMEQTGGCQSVKKEWGDVTAIQLLRQDRNCRVTVYTSTDCDPAAGTAVTIPEEVCIPAEPERTWKSFAIRGCLD